MNFILTKLIQNYILFKVNLKKYILDLKKYQFGYKVSWVIIPFYLFVLKHKGAKACFPSISYIKILNQDTANFCLAELYYYCGDFNTAILYLLKLKEKYPKKEEIYYLLNQCYLRDGQQQQAINILIEILKISKRKKTWLFWAKSIKNKNEFSFFKEHFFRLNKIENNKDINLINYYSEAALNSKEYHEAKNIWIMFKIYNLENLIKTTKAISNLSHKAVPALLNLRAILEQGNIPFFIISGTLLGCVRDQKILPYDKDIDIGIFEKDFCFNQFIKTIISSGFFEIMPIKDQYYLKLKHSNGIFIDIFIHYEQSDFYLHRTSKLEWKNKKFELEQINFLGQSFFIPKDYDLYLTENYGEDWKIPKINFDSNFDTPNATIINKNEMDVFYEKVKVYKYFGLKYLHIADEKLSLT